MANKPANIKDASPNANLVIQLERLLEDAKTGKIRTLAWVTGWDDDCVTHGWNIDGRTTRVRFTGGVTLFMMDIVTSKLIQDGDSGVCMELENGNE